MSNKVCDSRNYDSAIYFKRNPFTDPLSKKRVRNVRRVRELWKSFLARLSVLTFSFRFPYTSIEKCNVEK